MVASSGETLWTFSSGGPLVQAHRSVSDGPDGGGGVAIRGRTNPTVFPGVDGSLYAYGGGDGSGSGGTGMFRDCPSPRGSSWRRRHPSPGTAGWSWARAGAWCSRWTNAPENSYGASTRTGRWCTGETTTQGSSVERVTDGGPNAKRRKRSVLHRADRVRGPIRGQLDGTGAVERDVRRGHAADVDRAGRGGGAGGAAGRCSCAAATQLATAMATRVTDRTCRARVGTRELHRVRRRRGHAHAWTAHMPSTPVAVHDGRTGRAIRAVRLASAAAAADGARGGRRHPRRRARRRRPLRASVDGRREDAG